MSEKRRRGFWGTLGCLVGLSGPQLTMEEMAVAFWEGYRGPMAIVGTILCFIEIVRAINAM